MPKTTPLYADGSWRDALALYQTSTLPKKQVARVLGVATNSPREWDKRDRQADGVSQRVERCGWKSGHF